MSSLEEDLQNRIDTTIRLLDETKKIDCEVAKKLLAEIQNSGAKLDESYWEKIKRISDYCKEEEKSPNMEIAHGDEL